MLIAQAVNHRNPHVSLLALGLLDTLVQMCGYPFHLQISTKEFLNELVRRFPERPPPFPGPVMSRILELIHTWKEGICVESRWRDDLGNIRDMHRLLSFKGYRFRDIPRTPSAPTTSVRPLPSIDMPCPYRSLRTSSLRRNSRMRIGKHSLRSSRSSFGEGPLGTSLPRRNS
jgi:ADP-ribosylation factor-binding protein GGA